VSGGFVVLNPAGRDADQSFAQGAGLPDSPDHPPINYHAYAACMRGLFVRKIESVPDGTHAALVLLRKRNLRAALADIAKLKARGIRAWISLKESGAHQVADFLSSYDRALLFRQICAESDGYLSSTPDLESLYRASGCRDGFFAPTPYPVDEPGWDFGIPLEKRVGILVGTREFDVPSRNHWHAVAVAATLGRELETPVAVINNDGRGALRLIKAIRGTNPFLHIIIGPLDYRTYIKLVASHRIVFQLDASAVPGQVAGDALLCRMPCIGGNGAVDRVAFGDPVHPEKTARELMTSDDIWRANVDRSQNVAKERLSFAAVRALISGRMETAQ
jgi:hypothetical protein